MLGMHDAFGIDGLILLNDIVQATNGTFFIIHE